MDGDQTNKTKTEMTTSREGKEKIDITHYSVDGKGMIEVVEVELSEV